MGRETFCRESTKQTKSTGATAALNAIDAHQRSHCIGFAAGAHPKSGFLIAAASACLRVSLQSRSQTLPLACAEPP